MNAFFIGLIVGLFIGGALIFCVMAIVIVGKDDKVQPPQVNPIPLWEFTEKYITHNTLITLYREEYKKDEEGFRQHYLYPLEQVMDWQITANKDDEPYFKAHPDVHKSKYINAPVVKVIGGRYEINSIDKIALVLGVKEAEE